VKAQLVAFLTKKLLDSKLFVSSVESLHGEVSRLQQGAYDTLLQATRKTLFPFSKTVVKELISYLEKHDKRFEPFTPPHLEKQVKEGTHRPRDGEALKDQNSALRQFIEKTEKALREEHKEGKHHR